MSKKSIGLFLVFMGVSLSAVAIPKNPSREMCEQLYQDCLSDIFTSNATCRADRLQCEREFGD